MSITRKNPNEFGLSDQEIMDLFPLRKSPTAKSSTPPPGRISPMNYHKPIHLGHFGRPDEKKQQTENKDDVVATAESQVTTNPTLKF